MSDPHYHIQASQLAPWKGVPRYDSALSVLVDRLCTSIPEYGRLLDVGTGDGEVVQRIHSCRPDIVVDAFDLPGTHGISPGPNVRIFEGNLETISLTPNTYDAIAASLSLHHVSSENRQRAYDQLFQGLKSEGTIGIFDVYEVGKEEERAFRDAYIKCAGERVGPNVAASRYDSVVGPYALEQDHVSDRIKDRFPDRQISLVEAIKRIRKAGARTQNIEVIEWDNSPEEKKMKLILVTKEPFFNEHFCDLWASGRQGFV